MPALITAVPVLLVLKQPDLGTAVILSLVFVSIAGLTRIKLKSLATLVVAGGIAAPAYLELRAEGLPEGAHHHVSQPGS